MPKFVKKPQTQEMKADSTWANEQEDRIAASVDPLYDEVNILDKGKVMVFSGTSGASVGAETTRPLSGNMNGAMLIAFLWQAQNGIWRNEGVLNAPNMTAYVSAGDGNLRVTAVNAAAASRPFRAFLIKV